MSITKGWIVKKRKNSGSRKPQTPESYWEQVEATGMAYEWTPQTLVMGAFLGGVKEGARQERRKWKEKEKKLQEDKARIDHLQTQWFWYDGGDSGHGYWSSEITGNVEMPRYWRPGPHDSPPDIRESIDKDRKPQ